MISSSKNPESSRDDHNTRPLKLLISAYACQPGQGSEPGVGWSYVKPAARFHDVWVMTRSNNRALIEAELAAEPMPNVHWIYFDLPRWASFWKKGKRGLRLYYSLWQFVAFWKARKLHREVGFDLVHHATIVSYWLPTFVPFLPIPFVWGPVGGGESTPRSFRTFFNWYGRMNEALRVFARALSDLNPLVRSAARRAAIAFAATPETAARLQALGCKNVGVLAECAFSDQEIANLRVLSPSSGNPFRIMSVGRLVHWKGFELGLRAFARFHERVPDAEYWLFGDGSDRKRLQRLAIELGLQKSVVFQGNIPRNRVFEKLGECDVLLFPSFHDSGGWVTLEAMAVGRPVICLDLGGPGWKVTDATGIKVAAIDPEQTISDLTAALFRLQADPVHRAQLAQAGRRRVEQEFNSDRRAEKLAHIYEGLLAERSGAIHSDRIEEIVTVGQEQ